MGLNGVANVTDAMSDDGLLNAFVEGLLGGLEKLPDFGFDLAHTEGVARISTKAVEGYTAIYGNDITLSERHVVGYAMDYDLIDGSANGGWEGRTIGIGETLEGGCGPVVANEGLCQPVHLSGGQTRPDGFGYFCECCADQQVGLAQQLYFIVCLQINHPRLSIGGETT